MQELTGNKILYVYAVISGTHLFRAPDYQIEHTIAVLKNMGVKRLWLSNCTGIPVVIRLSQEILDAVFLNNRDLHYVTIAA
jgi:7,8-dihydropterin-6-yl-methyl-4-(beta-D-ribofuranosyl)aminobenzene 5'-phosphate synthase